MSQTKNGSTRTAAGPGPEGPPLLDVWRQGMRQTLAHFRAVPFTLAVLATFLAVGAVTGSFLSGQIGRAAWGESVL